VDAQQLVIDHDDLVDEVEDELATDSERGLLESLVEGLGETPQLVDVQL